MNETDTLRGLIAKARREREKSVRQLALTAQEAGHKIVGTTLNAIEAGTYHSTPTAETIRAIGWLANVSDEIAFAAAGRAVPGPPFAEELPPGVDDLTSPERRAAITMLRALVAQRQEINSYVDSTADHSAASAGASRETPQDKEVTKHDPDFEAIRRAVLADVEHNGQGIIAQRFDSNTEGRRAHIAPEHWVRGYRTVRIDDLFDRVNPFIREHTDPKQPFIAWDKWLRDLGAAVDDWDRANKNIQKQIIRVLRDCTLDQLRLLLEYVEMGLRNDFVLEYALGAMPIHWKRTGSPLTGDQVDMLCWTLNRLRQGRQTAVGYQQATLSQTRDAFDDKAADLLERVVDIDPTAADLPNAFETLRAATVLNGLYPTDVAHYIEAVIDLFDRTSTRLDGIGAGDLLTEIDEFRHSEPLAKIAAAESQNASSAPHAASQTDRTAARIRARRGSEKRPPQAYRWTSFDDEVRGHLQGIVEVAPDADFRDDFERLRTAIPDRNSPSGAAAYINAVVDLVDRALVILQEHAEQKAVAAMITDIEEFQRTHQLVGAARQTSTVTQLPDHQRQPARWRHNPLPPPLDEAEAASVGYKQSDDATDDDDTIGKGRLQ